jgi:energy-converting hydrogenase Eha subunit F
MKVIGLLVMLCACCEPLMAQTADCQSIPKSSDRLACYDKAAAPIKPPKSATSQTLSPQQDQGGDALSAENARLNAKINNICRGC